MGIASLICGGVGVLFWIVVRILNMAYVGGVVGNILILLGTLAAATGVLLGVLDILLKKNKDQKAAEAAGVQALPLPIGTILISVLGTVISFIAVLMFV